MKLYLTDDVTTVLRSSMSHCLPDIGGMRTSPFQIHGHVSRYLA